MQTNDYQDWGASVPHGVEAHFYPECESTNNIAVQAAIGGQQSPLWVIAGRQTGGRGRKGRTWVSEPGNLYTSLVFRPQLAPKDLTALPYVAALSVRDAVIALGASSAEAQCKWPNDILLNGKKVSGILIESSARSAEKLDYIVIGIGINLAHFPSNAAFPATSLKEQLGKLATPQQAIQALARSLRARLDVWDVNDFDPVREEWTACAWGLGQTRVVSTASESFEATLIGLDENGGLLAKTPEGIVREIVAADIFPITSHDKEDG